MPFPPILIPFPGDFASKHPVGAAVFVVLPIFMPFPFPGDLVLLFKHVGCAEGILEGVEDGCILSEGISEGVDDGCILSEGIAEGAAVS